MRKNGMSLPSKKPKMLGLLLSGRVNQPPLKSRRAAPRQNTDGAGVRLRQVEMQRVRKRIRLSTSMTKSMSRSTKRRLTMGQRKGGSRIGAKRRQRKRVGLAVQARSATIILIYLKTQRLGILNHSCPRKEKSRKKRRMRIYK